MTTPATHLRTEVLRFPEGFLWGAATSAYQIEGAVAEGGRTASIWDTYSHTPGKTHNGETGDVAVDHYHRFPEDIALMRELGLGAYRFSIAWPRVQPGGRGPANQQGLDFYSRLVDALLEEGIEPYPTLFHWDLPQELQDEGGWASRQTAYCFAEYAAICAEALGDRVSHWLTLNEPWCAAFLGYGLGRHAPGHHDAQESVAAVHHLLLAHGLAVEAIRETRPQAEIGIVLNLEPHRPLTPSTADVAAARLWDGMQNRIFLDPIFKGHYPKDVLDHLGKLVDLSHIHDGDDRIIAAPIDVLGVNYYRPSLVAARSEPDPNGWAVWPGDESIEPIPQEGPKTTMGWVIDPTGLAELLARLGDDYPGVPMILTENGASFDDVLDEDGRVHDARRVSFLDQHLRVVHDAIEGGLDLRAYFVWSLLDNFEWAEGYDKRFGIVFVDYETLRRTPKDSAHWYQSVIAANGLTEAP